MKQHNLNKNIVVIVSALFFACSLVAPIGALAATTPSLGAAASYGVLSDTYTNPTGPTTINGDVGFTTPPAVAPLGTHTNYGSGAPYSTAGTDQAAALVNLDSQVCTFTFVAPNVVLDTTLEHATTYGPGVYCTTGTMAVGTAGGITLSGAGTYIFRSGGALNAVASSTVNLGPGANACDVFWTPNGATTLNANSTFVGTVIPVSQDITVLSTTSWTGRALTFGHTVTTPDSDVTITVPTCTPAPATINVVKVVVGGSKVIADFPLFVSGTPVVSGATNTFAPGAYTITETTAPDYTSVISGDCAANGTVSIVPGDNKFCIVTNTYVVPPTPGSFFIAPLIDVIKVPSPLALPNGPGPVTYTYTLKNIGIVPMSNITMVGDTCSPITLISGDTNNDSNLDVDETWTYNCFTTLLVTHTNTVVATGWANGMSAVDIASATVIVGVPIIPPLIHVTKVPSPLALPAEGGIVTYTKNVTNPGTVPLSNVLISDDKCSPVNFISGDTNNDSKLDTNETWIYTCQTNLTQTTTNTATVSGQANGLTARDFAVATVVVAAPKLPNTGISPIGIFFRSLSIGMQGQDVTALQTYLQEKGFLVIPVGIAKGFFGNLTRGAVAKYQKSVALPQIGVFGPLTRAKLLAQLGR